MNSLRPTSSYLRPALEGPSRLWPTLHVPPTGSSVARGPGVSASTRDEVLARAGEALVSGLEVEARQAQLLHVVLAGGPRGRLAGLLHRGQDHGDQDANDRDHDQQLDQREAGPEGLPTVGG